jgi:DNA invertase Pin-like site-specific DNA recombinase
MAKLESSLTSERVTAGMSAAENRGSTWGRLVTQRRIVSEIETLATSPDLSVCQIQNNRRSSKAVDWAERSTSAPAINFPRLHYQPH